MFRTDPFLSNYSPFLKFIFLISLIIFTGLIIFFLGLLIALPFFGGEVVDILKGLNDYSNKENVALLKYLQFVNQIGIFVIPSIIFAYLVKKDISGYLRMNRKPAVISILLCVLLIFASLPVIQELVKINDLMKLPGFMSGIEDWMKKTEQDAAELTDAFLKTRSFGGLLINILLIGVVASIGEEFLFRGILLRLFNDWTKNVHIAIFISSILFSAFHLQFYGFLPRFLLGMLFGYLYVWSGSIWLPVVAHFINNSAAVIVFFLINTGVLNSSAESFGETDSFIILAISIFSMILFSSGIYFFEKRKIYRL